MTKPREFWICWSEEGLNPDVTTSKPVRTNAVVHVIEKSALMDEAEAHKKMASMYCLAMEQNDKLTAALKCAKDALGFYGDKDAWESVGSAITIEDEEGAWHDDTGDIARGALKQIEELMNG